VKSATQSEHVVRCRAVLFDFDGVIADTMQANLAAWQQAFLAYGVRIQPEDYLPLEGMRPADVASTLADKYALGVKAAQETPGLKERFFLAGKSCEVFPIIPALIPELRAAGLLLAIVTGSSKLRIESTLSRGVLALFDACVTADCTARGKPTPDPFLHAAGSLGLEPGDCVVVENAPLGIASAKRAGMRCIAVCSTLGPDSLSEADYIASDLKEVRRLLLPK
jgi:beta-phosphoglucomutase